MDKLLVIVCEEALEQHVGREIIACGAKGYTVSTVRGRGHRGVRDAQWLLSSNVRFEVLCSQPVAQRVAEQVREKFERNFGMVIYCVDASTLAP